MKSWAPAARVAMLCLLAAVPPSVAADEATLLRLFLSDGTSLVSYGEFARVGDRVVFSMPIAPGESTSNSTLQLVNIPADRVDWARTDRYAEAARAARYTATQGENDYVALSNAVARALNEVAFTTDPARRLALVQQARKTLADWPQDHFNYRNADVRQMLSLLDEAIADLRASAGGNRFDLSFVALAEPLAPAEPLLPPPTPREAIEGLLTVSQLAESAVERRSILSVVLVGLDRDADALPGGWAETIRAKTTAALEADLRLERAYQSMIRRFIGQADRRARNGDVLGVRRVLESLRRGDAALGGKRPDAILGAIAAVQAQLDAARRLRLARDRWALRRPVLRQYGGAMTTVFGIFRSLQEPLENIKQLSGSTQAALLVVERRVARVLELIEDIVPPEECQTAHAVLLSAAHLADNAAKIRREAARFGDMARAWDASSAAAGALMLSARAKTDIRSLLGPPRLQ